MQRIARVLVVVVAIAATLGLSACTPERPTYTVEDGSGPDANPGDGICASTTNGDCSLESAVTEANLAGGATILLPYLIDGADVTITSDITMRPAPGVGEANLDRTTIVVATGGELTATKLFAGYDESYFDVTVRGVAHLEGSWINTLVVGKAGNAVLTRSTVGGHPDYGNRPSSTTNNGQLLVWYSHLKSSITTLGSGKTVAAASLLTGQCTTGTVKSRGWNIGWKASCGLGAQDRDIAQGGSGISYLEGALFYDIDDDGPVVDLVPPGRVGCDDGTLKPPVIARDDDGDGIAECEPGPLQPGTPPL